MKRILSFALLVVVALTSALLLSCDKSTDKVKVLVPNGITLIAWGGLYDNPDVEIENIDGPDNLTVALAQGSYDIVVAPLNVGAKLYNNGQTKFKLDSLLTFGNNYIVSKEGVSLDKTLKDLEGKKLIAFGQNATPGIILRAALSAKGVQNCDVSYQNSVNEVVGLFTVNKEYDYALVAEPVLSQLQIKKGLKLNIVDLQEVLQSEMDSIPQAGVFVNPESKNINKVNKVLKALKSNIESLNEKPEEYAEKIVNYNEFFENISKEVIASAVQNGKVIDYKKAKDNKAVLKAYFELLINQNKNLLDKLPDDSFYY